MEGRSVPGQDRYRLSTPDARTRVAGFTSSMHVAGAVLLGGAPAAPPAAASVGWLVGRGVWFGWSSSFEGMAFLTGLVRHG
jgi:hypothetical protein